MFRALLLLAASLAFVKLAGIGLFIVVLFGLMALGLDPLVQKNSDGSRNWLTHIEMLPRSEFDRLKRPFSSVFAQELIERTIRIVVHVVLITAPIVWATGVMDTPFWMAAAILPVLTDRLFIEIKHLHVQLELVGHAGTVVQAVDRCGMLLEIKLHEEATRLYKPRIYGGMFMSHFDSVDDLAEAMRKRMGVAKALLKFHTLNMRWAEEFDGIGGSDFAAASDY